MLWLVKIPAASAARFERDRKLIIEENGAFHSEYYRFTIPEGAESIHFDFEFKENNDHEILDASISYKTYIEYRNSTGSRMEKVDVIVQPFPKCVKCDEYATYDSPEPFCDNHWAEWWAEGIAETPEEFEQVKQEALQICKEQGD